MQIHSYDFWYQYTPETTICYNKKIKMTKISQKFNNCTILLFYIPPLVANINFFNMKKKNKKMKETHKKLNDHQMKMKCVTVRILLRFHI